MKDTTGVVPEIGRCWNHGESVYVRSCSVLGTVGLMSDMDFSRVMCRCHPFKLLTQSTRLWLKWPFIGLSSSFHWHSEFVKLMPSHAICDNYATKFKTANSTRDTKGGVGGGRCIGERVTCRI